MEREKSMKDIFQKPVKTVSKFDSIKDKIHVVFLFALGLFIPWLGLPLHVVTKPDHKRNATILLIASLFGIVLWIVGAIYGWQVYKETFPRNPNL